jgi:hypothetical protein
MEELDIARRTHLQQTMVITLCNRNSPHVPGLKAPASRPPRPDNGVFLHQTRLHFLKKRKSSTPLNGARLGDGDVSGLQNELVRKGVV